MRHRRDPRSAETNRGRLNNGGRDEIAGFKRALNRLFLPDLVNVCGTHFGERSDNLAVPDKDLAQGVTKRAWILKNARHGLVVS